MKAFLASFIIVCLMMPLAPVTQEEDLNALQALGDTALSTGDYVTSLYYFNRIRDSEGWKDFPRKVDVLYKLGILMESQSRFKEAAEMYGHLLETLASSPQDPAFTLYDFYALKYGETLERAGLYEQSTKLYWILLKNSPGPQQQSLLLRIIRNYGFLNIDQEDLQKIHSMVMPGMKDTLGFELAELYRIHQLPQRAREVYEQVWWENSLMAAENASNMVEVYSALNALDDLLKEVRKSRNSAPDPAMALIFEIKLLMAANRGEEALGVLEYYAQEHSWIQDKNNLTSLAQHVPITLLDVWVDLIEQYREPQQAMDILRGVVTLVPMDVQRRIRLSDLMRSKGQDQEAIQLWTQWAQQYANNPLAILNAVEQLEKLGASDTAAQLMQQMKEQIPAPLAMKQGETLLMLGQYQEAFSAFQTAVTAGGVQSEAIRDTLLEHSRTQRDIKPLVGALIHSATTQPFADTPAWLRDSLIQLGLEYGYQPALQDLAGSDSSGAWYYHIGAQALRMGKRSWGFEMLKSIPDDSLYASVAEKELIGVYGQDDSIPGKAQAADLMRTSLAVILDTTEVMPLTYSLVETLLRYAELRLDSYQPGEALVAVRAVESASETLSTPLTPMDRDRLLYNRGRALVELGALPTAVPLLEKVKYQPYLAEAKYLLARIYLALKQTEEGQALLMEMAENPDHWQRSNDAISLISALEPLVGDSLENFGVALLYELQGRFDSAIPVLRQIAVDQFGTDTEEWARYQIGKLLRQEGKWDEAKAEWERLSVEVDHPILHGMIRYELLHPPMAAGASVDATASQEVLIDFPDTLFSDLTRLEIHENP